MAFNIAIIGATGTVGREIMAALTESETLTYDKVYALASRKSANREVSFGEDDVLKVEVAENFDFSKVDIVFSAAGDAVARNILPKAAETGAVVIDCSGYWRLNADVPLIVAGVNDDLLSDMADKKIIASPTAAVVQLVSVLKPLQGLAAINRVVVSTYQSTSGAGKAAMDELFNQTRHVYMNQPIQHDVFPKTIAFNVLPKVGDYEDDGSTGDEACLRHETRKILGDGVEISASCVQVPVFVGHAETVNIEFDRPVKASAARDCLREDDNVLVIDKTDEEDGYITPSEVNGDSGVYVSRLRQDPSHPNGLNMWIVADNLRRGAALNAVQIAEGLVAAKKL